MNAAVYVYPGRDSEPIMTAIATGLINCGLEVSTFNSIPDPSDVVVVWGFRLAQRVASHHSGPILVAERGYIDRHAYTALGWDGINGRARFVLNDDPSRFLSLFESRLKPWRNGSAGYALIIGQVFGDAQIQGVDIHAWYRKVGISLYRAGWDVCFRQHPVETERGARLPDLPFAKVVNGSLDDALAGAGIVVCYNSNTAVDSVLAGVPVHVEDKGSMVYDLGSHDLSIIKPDRERRLSQIANLQWSVDELASGEAWQVIKSIMHH